MDMQTRKCANCHDEYDVEEPDLDRGFCETCDALEYDEEYDVEDEDMDEEDENENMGGEL